MTWTAEDLKNALLNEVSEDEDNEEYGSSWDEVAYGKTVKNPEYNESASNEYNALLTRYWHFPLGEERDRAQSEMRAFEAHHGEALRAYITVPTTVTLNGDTYVVKVVEDNGGTEGGGQQAHFVFEVGGRLFRIDGSYYSYDGTHWDDDTFREVRPVVKEVTFYE